MSTKSPNCAELSQRGEFVKRSLAYHRPIIISQQNNGSGPSIFEAFSIFTQGRSHIPGSRCVSVAMANRQRASITDPNPDLSAHDVSHLAHRRLRAGGCIFASGTRHSDFLPPLQLTSGLFNSTSSLDRPTIDSYTKIM